MRETKKEKAVAAATEEASPRRNRRQLLALGVAAAAGTTAATLLPQAGGRAHAQVGWPLLIGEHNDGEDKETGLGGRIKGPPEGPHSVFFAGNVAGPLAENESAIALHGFSEHGHGITGGTRTDDPWRAGVMGLSHLRGGPPGEVSGPAAGVRGVSGTGPGVAGGSQSGPGVAGHSQSGQGVEGHSQSGHGVLGCSESAYGVAGHSQSGVGLDGHSPTGVGVAGSSVSSIAVKGDSQTGTGVQAESQTGLALDVAGKARFSTAGTGVVPARADAATVDNPAVTAASHITVTFTGDPGRASVAWVERQPGSGFIVHLSGKSRWAVPFTYLIVEPGT